MNIRFSRMIAGAVSVGLLVYLITASPGLAQVVLGGGNQNGQKAAMINSYRQQVQAHKERMSMRIAEMRRACQLTATQIQKFRVAAKGALNSAAKNDGTQVIESAKLMGIDISPEDLKNSGDGVPGAQVGVMMLAATTTKIEEQAVWQNAVKELLTDGQAAQWREWLASRDQFQLQSAVNHFVANVDRKLLLSETQRKALARHLTQKYGDAFLRSAHSDRPIHFAFAPNAGSNLDDTSLPSDIAQLLTDEQQQVWIRSFARQLESIVNPEAQANGRGVIMRGQGRAMMIRDGVAPKAKGGK